MNFAFYAFELTKIDFYIQVRPSYEAIELITFDLIPFSLRSLHVARPRRPLCSLLRPLSVETFRR